MVLKEVDYCIHAFRAGSILFDDDTFNVSDEHVREIAEGMARRNIQWQAMVRADYCSDDTFRIMRECGCMGLKIGLETLSDNALRINNKRPWMTAARVEERIHFLKDLGFELFLSAMQYVPGESPEEREHTQSFLSDVGVRYQYPYCTPFPGTPFFNKMRTAGLAVDDPALFDAYDAGQNSSAHSPLTELVKQYIRGLDHA